MTFYIGFRVPLELTISIHRPRRRIVAAAYNSVLIITINAVFDSEAKLW